MGSPDQTNDDSPIHPETEALLRKLAAQDPKFPRQLADSFGARRRLHAYGFDRRVGGTVQVPGELVDSLIRYYDRTTELPQGITKLKFQLSQRADENRDFFFMAALSSEPWDERYHRVLPGGSESDVVDHLVNALEDLNIEVVASAENISLDATEEKFLRIVDKPPETS